MRLTLFRHGIAIDRMDPACPPDEDRALTAEGVDKTRRAAAGLVALWGAQRPARLLTSPYLRAVQTADLLDDELKRTGGAIPRTVFTEVRPFDEPDEILAHLAEVTEDVVLVGHNPHLEELTALCIAPERAGLRLKKAGAALIDFDRAPLAGLGTLTGLYAPKVLRALGDVAA